MVRRDVLSHDTSILLTSPATVLADAIKEDYGLRNEGRYPHETSLTVQYGKNRVLECRIAARRVHDMFDEADGGWWAHEHCIDRHTCMNECDCTEGNLDSECLRHRRYKPANGRGSPDY